MTFKGGTVLVDTKTKSIKEIILEILEHPTTTSEFIHKNNPGQGVTFIFKINFNSEIFNNYFFNIDKSIQAPNVLIIKLLAHNFTSSTVLLGMPGRSNTAKLQPITINESQFQNEIATHKAIGSQSNIMPLCPSLLYHERINNGAGESTLTRLGKAFYNLLKKDETQFKSFETYLLTTLRDQDKLLPVRNSTLELKDYALYNVIQEMIIMEYVDCKTLFQIYHVKSTNSNEEKQFKNGQKFLYNTKIDLPKIHTEEVFYLLYLATLLAREGYSHGDLHTNNVLVCSKLLAKTHQIDEAKINVNPILIDFGKAEKLENLKFRVILGNDDAPIPITKSIWKKQNENFRDIYYTAQENQANIAKFIDEKLKRGEFVYAIIVISMCISITAPVTEPSMFMYYLSKKLYETFYSMYEKVITKNTKGDYIEMSINYDEKIKAFIGLRNSLLEKKMAPTVLDVELSGGKYNKHKYQKRTQRKRRRTLYKKNSKKTKKSKKSKKIKTRSIK